ncbi:uncharacterized protein METZ01_LOCUS154682, partial [marine metagenome]
MTFKEYGSQTILAFLDVLRLHHECAQKLSHRAYKAFLVYTGIVF